MLTSIRNNYLCINYNRKNKEKNSVKDVYNILNDAIEHLYPDLQKTIQLIKEKVGKEEAKNKPDIINDTEEDLGKTEKKQRISEDENKKCLRR